MEKLLKNTDLLEEILSQIGKLEVGAKYLSIFRMFQSVNDAFCCTVVDVSVLEIRVQKFKLLWKESGMSLIPKVHVICDHLLDFVKLHENMNMYQVSEQSHEALHAEFAKTWSKYAVKETSNPHYKDRLLRSVCDFNGSHAY